MKKELLVAVAYTHDKSCKEIYKVINVDEQEFKKLVNQKNEYKDSELKALEQKRTAHDRLVKRVETHAYIIAKLVYDSYVERGYFEQNELFEKMFYDHIFNGKDFDVSNIPDEYQTILDFITR